MKNQINIFNHALNWIKANTINGNGITVTSKQRVIYPEVTGYYIPSLLQWGERDLAVAYAKYLCSIQKEDGSWYDAYDNAPYVFDSAQILKGLLSIHDILPEVEEPIKRGCDWLVSNVTPEGRLVTPDKGAWGNDESFCSELIHIYCLTPLTEAAEAFHIPKYRETAYQVLNYYKETYQDKILHFSLLSHFYAYVMEGLLDLGETKLVRDAMTRLEEIQSPTGSIPGLNDVKWICSTGLFQLALVWYKLGELEKGNKLFSYACTLQNESGGWFGSYSASWSGRFARGRKKAYYFPDEEISWANKYFLDALTYKEHLEFEKMSSVVLEHIDENDGRYLLIKRLNLPESYAEKAISVCDVGCGKGRYLKRLTQEYPQNHYYAVDLSEKVMQDIDYITEKRTGRLTQIPYADHSFHLVYTCEAMEHAINLEGAFKELYRTVKPGGKLVIINKPQEKLGQLQIDEWEQWISDDDIRTYTEACGGSLEIIPSVPYETNKNDGLFRAWIITKH